MVSDRDIRRVAADCGLDERTVRRCFAGAPPRSRVTLEAIERACRNLGVAWSKPPSKRAKAFAKRQRQRQRQDEKEHGR